MDGEVSSSGGMIGSAFVTIGADLSALKAAEAEARQIAQRIGQISANVPLGGGGGGGGAPITASPSFGAPAATAPSSAATPSFGAPQAAAPSPVQATPAFAAPTDTYGFINAFKVGNGIQDSFINDAWSRLSAGKPLMYSDNPKTLEGFIQAAATGGGVHSRDDVAQLVSQFYGKPNPAIQAASQVAQIAQSQIMAPAQAAQVFPGVDFSGGVGSGAGEIAASVLDNPTARLMADQYRSIYRSTVGELSGEGGRGSSRILGLRPIAALYIAQAAVGGIASAAEAVYQAGNSRQIAQGFDRPASAHDFFNDPVTQSNAAGIAMAKGQIEFQQGLGQIPVIGVLNRLGNALDPDSIPHRAERTQADLERQQTAYERAISIADKSAVHTYELSGDKAGAVREANRQRQVSDLRAVETARGALSAFDADPSNRQAFAAWAPPTEAETAAWKVAHDTRRATLQQSLSAAVGQLQAGTIDAVGDERQAEATQAARLAELGSLPGLYRAEAGAIGMDARAVTLLAGRTPGSQVAALRATDAGAKALAAERLKSFDELTPFKIDAATPIDKEGVSSARTGEREKLVAQQGKEQAERNAQMVNLERQGQEEILRARGEGQAALLAADRQHFAASVALFYANSGARILAVSGGPAEGAVRASVAIEGVAMQKAEINRLEDSKILTDARIVSAVTRNPAIGGAFPFSAMMAEREAREEVKLRNIENPFARYWEAQAFGAEQQTLRAENWKNQYLKTEEYSFRGEIARAQQQDMPITARALAAIASATLEVQQAGPEGDMRKKAVAAATEELKAAKHDLLLVRGGEVAIDMSASEALGTVGALGLDLTGRKRDRAAAAKALDAGAAGLGGAADDPDKKNPFGGNGWNELPDAVKALTKTATDFFSRFKGVGMFN